MRDTRKLGDMPPLRIFVAESDEVIRHVMAAMIAHQPGWGVCGEASTSTETIEQVHHLKPDVLLLDFGFINPNVLELTRQIVENDPTQRIIITGGTDYQSMIREAFDAGALGYIIKANASRDLVVGIKALQEGRTFFTPRIAETILHSYLQIGQNRDLRPLRSERERMAVKLLAREAATTLNSRSEGGTIPRPIKYVLIAGTAVVIGVFGWMNYHDTLEDQFPIINKTLVQVGLRTVPPPMYEGNPNTKVWVDLHTALYYCPGAQLYGRTGKGKFTKQHDALADHFEPATRKACD
jgi:DNA-binding NarL/FixJ family response regulator